MKYKILPLLISLIAIKAEAQDIKNYPNRIDHVIIIGIDGMSPDGIRKAKTPVMHKMIAEGSVKWKVRTVLPSDSSPNWASMIMGAGTEAHGVLNNDWEQVDASLPPIVGGESGLFPTIFSVVRAMKPTAEIGAVYQWEGFGRLFEKEAVSFNKTNHSEDSTAIKFNKYLKDKRPTFAFLQLDDVDGAGHGQGHGTPAYYQAVSKVDSIIGGFLQTIKEAGIAERTLVIVTADHGGVGFGHGGATPEEAEIAMIFYGAGVKQGYQIKQQVYTYDLAATIAFALKITPPYAWTGRPVRSAFSGFNEPDNLWMGKDMVDAPVIYPDKYLYTKAGGLYIDQPAVVKIEPAVTGSEVHLTTDGSEPAISSTRYEKPLILDKTTVVKARSFNKAGSESKVTTAYFRVAKSTNGNGLHTSFYLGSNWEHLPVFDELKIAGTWVDHEFNINNSKVLPLLEKGKSTFAVSMKGYLAINVAGSYTFYTQSDDGSQLFIDGQRIVDNNDSHSVTERSGTLELKKGRHAITVNYFNQDGGYWLDVLYKGPGIEKQLIPADLLFLKDSK